MVAQKQEKGFAQLSQEERVEIYSFLREGLSYRAIGDRLGRNHTTISREIKRNSRDYGRDRYIYKPLEAEKKRLTRKHSANQKLIKLNKNISLRTKIYQLLSSNKDRGPDEILGRLRKEGREVVSTPTLYRYIHAHGRGKHLLYKKRGYRKRYSKQKRGKFNDGIPIIDARDPKILTRQSGYHWEGDTIVSKDHKGGAVTLVERRSRYTCIRKIHTFESSVVYTVMHYLLYPEKKETLTMDNGKEFAKLALLQKKLGIQCYRTHTYASYERGTNERTNGLIRRYLPKGCDINLYSHEEIEKIVQLLNHKPRKILDYRTPYEVYHNLNLIYLS